MNAKQVILRARIITIAAMLFACATNDNPPCRRVSAGEFMRAHTFKGLATDRFIGVAGPPFSSTGSRRAFKQVWELGLFHGWAVLWVPTDELPSDYLANAHNDPNRRAGRRAR